MKLSEAIKRAKALPRTGEGVEELMEECFWWDPNYKRRVYSEIAWATGLTFDEIGAIDSKAKLEVRHGKR